MSRPEPVHLAASDGVRLAYTAHGDPVARPVVLLAGFKAPGTSWHYQIGPLARAGHRVIVVDVRGHGAAERPELGVDMERRGDDVHDVLEALDLRGAVLVGGSMGGNTIWSYTSRHGSARVAGVVIVDQTPRMRNGADWSFGFYGYDEGNADTYFAAGIPPTDHGTPLWRRGARLVRLVRAMSGTDQAITPGELALLNDHAKRDWRPVIAGFGRPVLFVAGSDSEFWPSGHAAASAALAPDGHSGVIRSAGHAANIEQPAAFNRALLEFLRRRE